MKKFIYIGLSFCLSVFAEAKIAYKYDKAGNRVSRLPALIVAEDPGKGKDTAIVVKPGTIVPFGKSNSEYFVYPNPTTDGIVQVQSLALNAQQDAFVAVYTVDAVLIVQERIVEGSVTVDLSTQPAGTYFFYIVWNEGYETKKITKL